MRPYATDRASLERDCDLDVFTGPGPGGQHRNKTRNAVRLHHRPSGIMVTASEQRSLHQNLEAAYERLSRKLEKLNEIPTPRRKTRPSRSSKLRRLEEKRQRAKTKRLRQDRPLE